MLEPEHCTPLKHEGLCMLRCVALVVVLVCLCVWGGGGVLQISAPRNIGSPPAHCHQRSCSEHLLCLRTSSCLIGTGSCARVCVFHLLTSCVQRAQAERKMQILRSHKKVLIHFATGNSKGVSGPKVDKRVSMQHVFAQLKT